MGERFVARNFALIMFATALSRQASAQVSPANQAAAQVLFDEGRRLMNEGKFAEACPKLEESQRLDPGGGTLLNLAHCHEQQGRVATAWSEYNEALSIAIRDGRDVRVRKARERISALEPLLPRVLIEADPEFARLEGAEVRIDNTEAGIGRAAWGIPTPIDPGAHAVTAVAPGYKEWKGTFEVEAKGGSTVSVKIGALERLPAPSTDVATKVLVPPQKVATKEPSRAAAFVSFGVAAGGFATGSIFGLLAMSNRSKSDQGCPTDQTCSSEAAGFNRTAIAQSWIATAAFGVGMLGAGVGTYFWLRKPESAPQTASAGKAIDVASVRVGPYVGTSQAGLTVAGAF